MSPRRKHAYRVVREAILDAIAGSIATILLCVLVAELFF